MKTTMKRALLGTTAVVGLGLLLPAPVFAAEPMVFSIDGTITIEAYFVDQDDESRFTGRSTHLETDDGGFNLRARGEADNGLVYGAKIEVDTDGGGGTLAIDEQMIFFSGGWGRLELGNEDGAEDVMYTSAASLAVGSGGIDGGSGSVFDVNGVSVTSPDIVDSGDATKITYFTPRINGIQLGITYAPDTGADATDSLRTLAADGNNQLDFIGFGANFVQTFDEVSIRLAVVAAT
ncbi:MAG: porin, partial [Planctomycetes bacterium]|nr:porin [Planctomycetota bacterium]